MADDTEGLLIAVPQLQHNGMPLRALTIIKHSIETNITYKVKPVVQLPWQLNHSLSVWKQGGGGVFCFPNVPPGGTQQDTQKHYQEKYIISAQHESELSHCLDCQIYVCCSHNQTCITPSVEPDLITEHGLFFNLSIALGVFCIPICYCCLINESI